MRTTERGAVEVDEHLRTSQPHIYALGDVNGGPQFTYISLDDSRIVLDQLVGEGRRSTADRVAIPRTLFMTPPLATVGLTEKEAREAGHRVKIASQPVADIVGMPRAYAVEETRGLMKFVIDAETDEILGAALLSIDAQELINTVALAMRHGITAAELRDADLHPPQLDRSVQRGARHDRAHRRAARVTGLIIDAYRSITLDTDLATDCPKCHEPVKPSRSRQQRPYRIATDVYSGSKRADGGKTDVPRSQ